MSVAAPAANRSSLPLLPLLVLLSVFTVVLLRTAWVCDDAYITFRTIDNWVHGYGLRWNVAERVQTFTHPLWLFVVSAGYVVTREPYFTSLVFSAALSIGALWYLARGLAASATMAIVTVVLCLSSKAFVDFSTSGLENPLTHFLLVIFFLVAWRAPATPRTMMLATGLSSLVMLTRIDLGLLVLPTVGIMLLRSLSWRTLRAVIIGLLPFAAWEFFSIAYYGFPFPNTAYAKLNTGIPEALLRAQGIRYLADSLRQDPLSLATMAAAVVVTGLKAGRAAWPAAVSIVLYLAYTVWIGGDFMSGRFIAAPFLVGVCLIARHGWTWPRAVTAGVCAAILALALLAPTPSLLTGSDFKPVPAQADEHGIGDVRRYYYPIGGLLRTGAAFTPARDRLYDQGLEARNNGTHLMFVKPAGLIGFAAGPRAHLVDVWALGDPMLARLPSRQDRWTIGHFARRTPEGYPETIESGGRNQIVESGVAAYYDRLSLLTRGPIWTNERWRAIWKMNRGLYQPMLRTSSYFPAPK